MAARNLIPCGKVVKPHGLGGELCIIWYADSPLILNELTTVYLQLPGATPKVFTILAWRMHKKMVLLLLNRVAGRDLAEKWRGAELLVDARDLPRKDEDEVYLYELLDCRVYLKDDVFLGVIRGFLREKGSEIWRIMTPEDREVLFPAHDDFILELDPHRKRAVIDPPEGLLDLYLQD